MISISDYLEDIIKDSPFIEEGLSRGIINYSAYAREIKPIIEKRLFKNIKEGAIVMALKNSPQNRPTINLTDITVRSNLIAVTFANSTTLPDKQRQLLNELASQKDIFCTFSEGVRETTFIASTPVQNLIKKLLEGESELANINDLSSITIRLPKENIEMPGLYYQILKRLAWENINIIEIISTNTELTIILKTKDVDKAFSVLKNI